METLLATLWGHELVIALDFQSGHVLDLESGSQWVTWLDLEWDSPLVTLWACALVYLLVTL